MAGPLINVGVSGSGRYAIPDYSPITRGMTSFGQGIGQGLGALFDRKRQEQQKAEQDRALKAMLGAGSPREALMANPAFASDPNFSAISKVLWPAPPERKERRIIKGADGYSYYADTGDRVLPGVTAPIKDARTTEQKNVAAYMERNPGATEADYFAMKRAPGTTVNVGGQAPERGVSAYFDPQTGSELKPEGDYRFAYDPKTGSMQRDDAGYPIQVAKKGGKADPGAKADEATTKLRRVAEGGRAALDVLNQKDDAGKSMYEHLADFGQTAAARLPVLGNYLLTPEYQMANQAVTSFIERTLRLASGAAVPESEVDRYREIYSPRPGDSAEVIKQKMENLQRDVDSAIRMMGGEPAPQAPVATPEPVAEAPPQRELEAKQGWIDMVMERIFPSAKAAESGDIADRIAQYPGLSNDQLSRQIDSVMAKPSDYSSEELEALLAEVKRRGM